MQKEYILIYLKIYGFQTLFLAANYHNTVYYELHHGGNIRVRDSTY